MASVIGRMIYFVSRWYEMHMRQILAHSTESPQEAEELTARLRAAGVEVEVREQGTGALTGVLEASRQTWELWVPDAAEPAARKVIDEESKVLEAERASLDEELEAEAVAMAAPDGEKPPEPKPVKEVTQTARLAGTLMIADVFLGIAHHIWFALTTDAPAWDLENFFRYGISLAVALSLRGGSRGAWKLSLMWVVVQSLYYFAGSLYSPPIVPISVALNAVALLLMLLGGESALRRKLGPALWGATSLVSLFPLMLAPAALVRDPLVGQWRRAHLGSDVIAFCGDGRLIESGAKSATWRRVGLHVVEITPEAQDTERRVYWAFPDHLTFRNVRWWPDRTVPLCGEPKAP